MSATNDGGSAFPIPQNSALKGMSLRDWFAGQFAGHALGASEGDRSPEELANACYRLADAMLAARSKGGQA